MNKVGLIVGGLGAVGLLLIVRRKPPSAPSFEAETSQPQPQPQPQQQQNTSPPQSPLVIPKAPSRFYQHSPVTSKSGSDPAHEVLALTNAFRATGGTCGGQSFAPSQALLWDEKLAASAMKHAQDMANRAFFDHINPDGIPPERRMQSAGWTTFPMGENIAAGQTSPAAVVQAWKESPGHCINLLRSTYRHVGIAYYFTDKTPYKHYWVQNFGG